jgi:carbon starvation protein
VLAPAKSLENMHQVVGNSTGDGILAAIFALLVVAVLVGAARVWIRALRRSAQVTTTEVPPEPSRIWAPVGLFFTAAERERIAAMATPGESRPG